MSQPLVDDPSATRPGPRPLPARHPGRVLFGVVVFVLIASLIFSLLTNPNMQWQYIRQYFFTPDVLRGLLLTLELTVVSMAIGMVLGVVTAIMNMSPNRVLNSISSLYLWFFRGTPVLVQLIFWYNLSALYPELWLGIPHTNIGISVTTNEVITPFIAAMLGLGLNEGAYMAEIVRGGLLSVDHGQREAASSLGMSRFLTLWRIVLPQAMRFIVPPTGNQVIGMLKTTSLVSVLALPELLYSVQMIYASNYRTIPLLSVACIWYLIVTSILTIGQRYIERYYSRGSANAGGSKRWLPRRQADLQNEISRTEDPSAR